MNTASGTITERPVSAPAGNWSRRRWWTLVMLAFAAQLGFFLVFEDRTEAPPQAISAVSVLNLLQADAEWLALTDPTLFALPNAQGVAGQAWLNRPAVPFTPFRWTIPPRLLAWQTSEPGAVFARLWPTNPAAALVFEAKPEPEVFVLSLPGVIAPTMTQSTVRVTGALAERRWLNTPTLRSWTGIELLTNTVVQILVQADGRVFSTTLLVPPGPGTNDQLAVEYALQLAREARFEPLATGAEPTLGTLIFEWHIQPPPPP